MQMPWQKHCNPFTLDIETNFCNSSLGGALVSGTSVNLPMTRAASSRRSNSPVGTGFKPCSLFVSIRSTSGHRMAWSRCKKLNLGLAAAMMASPGHGQGAPVSPRGLPTVGLETFETLCRLMVRRSPASWEHRSGSLTAGRLPPFSACATLLPFSFTSWRPGARIELCPRLTVRGQSGRAHLYACSARASRVDALQPPAAEVASLPAPVMLAAALFGLEAVSQPPRSEETPDDIKQRTEI